MLTRQGPSVSRCLAVVGAVAAASESAAAELAAADTAEGVDAVAGYFVDATASLVTSAADVAAAAADKFVGSELLVVIVSAAAAAAAAVFAAADGTVDSDVGCDNFDLCLDAVPGFG